jgi:hypothetical protein
VEPEAFGIGGLSTLEPDALLRAYRLAGSFRVRLTLSPHRDSPLVWKYQEGAAGEHRAVRETAVRRKLSCSAYTTSSFLALRREFIHGFLRILYGRFNGRAEAGALSWILETESGFEFPNPANLGTKRA